MKTLDDVTPQISDIAEAGQVEERFKTISTYVLLLVAMVLAALLWIFHGAVIGLGFIFLEVQFLLVLSALGTFTDALRKVGAALNLLISGGASQEEQRFSEVVDTLKKNAPNEK